MGDILMSSGEARRLWKATGKPVLITDRSLRPVRSDLFNGLPYIIFAPTQHYQHLINGSGTRPYILSKLHKQWTWRKYQPQPAEIVFTPEELAFAEPYRGLVMLEPNVKAIGHRNKDWGTINWTQLDSALHLASIKTVQCGPPGTRYLPHVKGVETMTFRQACAVLSVARAFVGHEGGLHHAAAAVGTPAVVIFGGFISPKVTGYASHRNLFTGGTIHSSLGCGRRTECQHCRDAMNKILPSQVFNELRGLLAPQEEKAA
jgi:ADP-heptose:LPS heptosyltransferase